MRARGVTFVAVANLIFARQAIILGGRKSRCTLLLSVWLATTQAVLLARRSIPDVQEVSFMNKAMLTQDREHVEAPLAPEKAASAWLGHFERALIAQDKAALSELFGEECHWRDLVSFTWTVTQFEGRSAIVDRLLADQRAVNAKSFEISSNRSAPHRASRAGVPVIEAIFGFETDTGRGYGMVRLLQSNPKKAFSLLTSLHEFKGHEEPIHTRRPMGSGYARSFGSENWVDRRNRERAFADREPAVLVVGAGQAGLALAASLKMFGVDTLVVDRHDRVGDNWRKRYHSLALHNEIQRNHLPYLPFPPNWPRFLSKDMLADWFETYAMAMELNVWTGTTLVNGSFDDKAGNWCATVRRSDGTERTLRPRHLVFANGLSGTPRYVKLPGIEAFNGEVIHTHQYQDGSAWKGKHALVFGTGASGHDVAQDLHTHGAQVSIVQRGSTTVTSLEGSQVNHSLYAEDVPLEDSDMIAAANTYPLLVRTYQLNVQKMIEIDKELLAGLTAVGFRHDQGEDDTGHQMKLRRRGGGYYLNVGCSDLIIDGEIGLIQNADIERIVADGALMKDGHVQKADLIVTASGYLPPQELVREMLGNEIAERVGPIWGIASDGEMNNMYRRTAQKGLWFMGGGLAQCRIYSRVLALQIKASELGLID